MFPSGWKGKLTQATITRVNAIKKIQKFTNMKFAWNLANALFIGKFNYAAEIWGGAPKYIIKKFQSLQLEAACAVIGPRSLMWNTTTLLKEMDWMNIEQLHAYDTFGALVQLPVPVEVEFQNCFFLIKLTFFFIITNIYIYKLINSYKKKYKFDDIWHQSPL